MSGSSWDITRRGALALLGSPFLAGSGSPGFGIRVTGPGFEVLEHGTLFWRVDAAAALGPGCTVELAGPDDVVCTGRSAGQPCRVELRFARQEGWSVGGRVVFATDPPIQLHAMPLPRGGQGLALTGRIAPGAAARLGRRLFPHWQVQPHGLTLDGELKSVLELGRGAAAWPGLRVPVMWALEPGDPAQGRYSRLASAELPGDASLPLGASSNVAVSLQARDAVCQLVRRDDGWTGVLLRGNLALHAGTVRLPLDSGAEDAVAAFGTDAAGHRRAELSTWLAKKEVPVRTPHGTVELSGDSRGAPNVVVRGNGSVLHGFDSRCILTGTSLRLPLDGAPRPRRFAELGRLDFGRSSFAIHVSGLGAVPEADGVLLLAPGKAVPLRFLLDDARLTVRRGRDLLSLVFGFRGLVLEAGRGRLQLRAVPGAGDKPSLRVQFPPQHVEEHAFFRQRPTPPRPNPPLTSDQLAQARVRASRLALNAVYKPVNDPNGDPKDNGYARFLDAYRLDADQKPDRFQPDDPDYDWFGEELAFGVAARQAMRLALKPQKRIEDIRLGLEGDTVAAVIRGVTGARPEDAGQPGTVATPAQAHALMQGLMAAAEARDSDHMVLQAAWRNVAPRKQQEAIPRFYMQAWKDTWPRAEPVTARLIAGTGMWDRLASQGYPGPAGIQGEVDAVFDEQPGPGPVEARAAGVSLLVFEPAMTDGVMPYTLEALLDWKAMPLRVSARAERFEPTSPADVAEALGRFGILPGTDAAARMLQIRESLLDAWAAPELHGVRADTRIEVPSGLFLSPASDARWNALGTVPPTGPAPLWRVELMEKPGRPHTLRCIGSPDFAVGAFAPGGHGPPRGPQPSLIDTNRVFRTALDRFDRHQLVGLSGAYGLPVIPRYDEGGKLNASQVAPPPGYALNPSWWTAHTADRALLADLADQAIYVPQALPTRLLALSAMGATFEFDAAFNPPSSLRDPATGRNLFDAFSIDRVHGRYTLGRAVLVEVLYRGFLLPFGHRATLVKVSERRFEPGPGGASVAVLTQRLYVEVATPDKAYPAVGQPFAGRGFPAAGIRLVTTRTPDLVEPFDPAGGGDALAEQPSGALTCLDQVGLVFWPRTSRSRAGDVAFGLRVDGASDVVAMPMLFIDNQAAHDPPTMRRVQAYYNGLDARRRLLHAGARRRYAPPRLPGDTSFETVDWTLHLDSLREDPDLNLPPPQPGDLGDLRISPALESADQVPLYPRLESGRIHHGPAARFSGRPQVELTVTYLKGYLTSDGFGGVSQEDARKGHLGRDTFLEVQAPVTASLEFGDNGDSAGGLARPAHPIRALARIGPVGSAGLQDQCPPQPATRLQPPSAFVASFFDDKAKILGVIPLRKIVEVTLREVGADKVAAPLLQETLAYACDTAKAVGTNVCGVVDDIREATSHVGLGGLGFGDLYPEADAALDAAHASAKFMAGGSCDPTMLAKAAADFQRLAQALERVAANPVAPLLDAARSRVEAGREWIATERTRLAGAALAARSDLRPMLDAQAALLLPVTVDWLLRRIDPQAQVALAGTRGALAAALAGVVPQRLDAWVKDPAPLPPTLAVLRTQLAEQARNALLAVAVPPADFAARVALDRLATAAKDGIERLPAPGLLADLYAMAVAATVSWQALVDAWSAALAAALGAVAQTAEDVCAGLGSLAALLPPNLPAHLGCVAPAGCPAPGTDWCATVWKNWCDLPPAAATALRAPTEVVFAALERLAGDVAELPTAAGPSCDPVALGAAWQRVPSDWAAVLAALADWADALAALPATAEADARKLALLVLDRLLPPLPSTADLPFPALRTAFAGLKAARDRVADTAVPLRTAVAALKAALAAVRDQAAALPGQVGDLVLDRVRAAAAAQAEALARSARPALADLYGSILDARNRAAAQLGALDSKLGGPDSGTPLACTVFDAVPPQPGPPACDAGTHDALWNEAQLLQDPGTPVLPRIAALAARWAHKAAAPQRIATQLEQRLRDAAAATVVRVLDLGDLRTTLAETVATLVPAQVRNEYRFDVPLNPFDVIDGVVFKPAKDGTLSVTATTATSLAIRGRAPTLSAPEVDVEAKLSAFALDLASAITLHFKPFTYSAGTGRKGRLTAELDHVEFGPVLAFLAALAAFFAYSDSGGGGAGKALRNGPYLLPRRSGPGLLAGYRLGIPAFSIGNVGFANIALDAHLELPFDGAPGLSVLGLSSRESPFVISYAPYGGAGFAVIESDGHGPRRMDFQLEFGGAAVVNYTPLQGTGRAMTGFYISHRRPDNAVCGNPTPLLFGTHSASFTGSVAGFGVASCFYMTMGIGVDRRMTGSVTLTFSFSVGPVAVDFAVTVTRDEGGSLQSGSSADVKPSEGAEVKKTAFLGAPRPAGMAKIDVPSPGQDWTRHRTLFDLGLRARGRRAA